MQAMNTAVPLDQAPLKPSQIRFRPTWSKQWSLSAHSTPWPIRQWMCIISYWMSMQISQYTPERLLRIIVYLLFFYFCANSLYTTMFDPVKRILPRLIPCKKNSVEPIESVEVRMLWLQPVHLRNATDKSHKGIIKRTIIDLESLKSGIHCLTICAIQLLDRPA